MDDGTVEQPSMQVPAPMPVEIEGAEMQPSAEPVSADPEAMLDLGPQHVVGPEEAALGQQLTDQPLEAGEGGCQGFQPWRAPRAPQGGWALHISRALQSPGLWLLVVNTK